jgi:hypothetical protein
MPLSRLEFINAAWTPYHAVEEASKRLMAAGFTHIAEKDAWNLQPGAWDPAGVEISRGGPSSKGRGLRACCQQCCILYPVSLLLL